MYANFDHCNIINIYYKTKTCLSDADVILTVASNCLITFDFTAHYLIFYTFNNTNFYIKH